MHLRLMRLCGNVLSVHYAGCRASAKKRHVRALNGVDVVVDAGDTTHTHLGTQQQCSHHQQVCSGFAPCSQHTTTSKIRLYCCCSAYTAMAVAAVQEIDQLQQQLAAAEQNGQDLAAVIHQLEGVQHTLQDKVKRYKHR